MVRTAREYFNRQAPAWKEHPEENEKILAHLRDFGIRPNDRILDVGCGTGRLTPLLRQLTGPGGFLINVDYASDMLRVGREKNGHDHWVCADACRLSFREASFDKIVCFSTFPHIHNPGSALLEIYRLLIPGGRVLILHTCCSIKLNAMHARLNGVIATDRLPRANELEELARSLRFTEITCMENPQLYWVTAQKAPI